MSGNEGIISHILEMVYSSEPPVCIEFRCLPEAFPLEMYADSLNTSPRRGFIRMLSLVWTSVIVPKYLGEQRF